MGAHRPAQGAGGGFALGGASMDAKEMIGLRQIKCEDPLWIEAMELIADSQKVQSTKTYFYFQEAGEDGKLKSIPWISQPCNTGFNR